VAETVQALDPDKEVQIAGLVDAQWLPRGMLSDRQMQRTAAQNIAYWGAKLDESCLAKTQGNALCLQSWFLREHIDTRFFVYMDQHDSAVVSNLGFPDLKRLDARGKEMVPKIAAAIRAEAEHLDGVFCPRNNWHCAAGDNDRFFGSAIDGVSYAEAFGNWYFRREGKTKLIQSANTK
jgi:hypothetical protein